MLNGVSSASLTDSPFFSFNGAIAISMHQLDNVKVEDVDGTLQRYADTIRSRVRGAQTQALLLSRRAGRVVLTSIERPHYQNFIDAIRANDPKILTCDILEGHLSAALPHVYPLRAEEGCLLELEGLPAGVLSSLRRRGNRPDWPIGQPQRELGRPR